ncbi:MAG: DEAD/DEAH box helicase family protein [Paenisporosarcina sp.]
MELMEHQQQAVDLLDTGKILYGGVGVGKSATALAYYIKAHKEKDLYVITTAKKRDSLDWEREAARYGISTQRDFTLYGTITVDSWNNIERYLRIDGSFFIFDEQRVVGSGVWVRAFLRIARKNQWILLSATPGDTWMDYAPVFVANGWYKNLTDFKRQHVVYVPYIRFPKILKYVGEARLEKLRSRVLVEMPYIKHTVRRINYLDVGYDVDLWNKAVRQRWNPYTNRPLKDVSELFRVMRKIVNTHPSRLEMVRMLMKCHPKLIVFYNFNYELEILRGLEGEIAVAEWNGHRKQPVPKTDRWIYLVQYNSGSEGWNCTETDAMILYSLTYSYKNHVQSQGRIDRIDTAFIDLYYYILNSDAPIDKAVRKALEEKRNFNEQKWLKNDNFPANF